MIDSLEWAQAGQLLGGDPKILPSQIPIQVSQLVRGKALGHLVELGRRMQIQRRSKVVLLLLVALEGLHGEHAATKWLNLDLPALNVGQLGLFLDGAHLHFIDLRVVPILAFLLVCDGDLLVAHYRCMVVLTLRQHQKWLIRFILRLHAVVTCLS